MKNPIPRTAPALELLAVKNEIYLGSVQFDSNKFKSKPFEQKVICCARPAPWILIIENDFGKVKKINLLLWFSSIHIYSKEYTSGHSWLSLKIHFVQDSK